MGRKTKKEKIIADLRRKLVKVKTDPELLSQERNLISFNSPALSKNFISPPLVPTDSIYIYPIQMIKKDLTKTAWLSGLAIGIELILFYLLQGKIRLPLINFSLPVRLTFS